VKRWCERARMKASWLIGDGGRQGYTPNLSTDQREFGTPTSPPSVSWGSLPLEAVPVTGMDASGADSIASGADEVSAEEKEAEGIDKSSMRRMSQRCLLWLLRQAHLLNCE